MKASQIEMERGKKKKEKKSQIRVWNIVGN
jgi:hypothetical protein